MQKLIVAFEGIDGAGKTTQIRMAESYLQDKGVLCKRFREPGGTKLGETLRDIILNNPDINIYSETALFAIARRELIENEVCKAVQNGEIILLDRSFYSSLAYQGVRFGYDGTYIVREINYSILGGLKEYLPTHIFFFDLSPDIALARIDKRGQQATRFETSSDGDYLSKVAEKYKLVLSSSWSPIASETFFFNANQPPSTIFLKVKTVLDYLIFLRETELDRILKKEESV